MYTGADTLGYLRALLKWDKVKADNFLFRLHYKVTFGILVVCAFVVTCKQYVGDPIDCITSAAVEKLIDQYCWVHSTYTMAKKDQYGRLVYSTGSHLGVHGDPLRSGDEKVYHRYYQWVCFILFLQAVLFYVPHYIWQIWEGGRLKLLVVDLKLPTFDHEEINLRRTQILQYFTSHQDQWFAYAYRFYFCEILNFINITAQIYYMDKFLGHMLSSYGFDLLSFTEEEPYHRTDPLAKIFPKVTKCTFNAHGFGGNIVNHDAICILSVNNINEKIYIFLWFWFILLASISFLVLPYRILTTASSTIRYSVIRLNFRSEDTLYHLRHISRKIGGADWFVLCQIAKNVNSALFNELVQELDGRLNSWRRTRVKDRQKLNLNSLTKA